MKVLVVAPGHVFSTIDVYTGLCAGLWANGVEVIEYPLHDTLETMAMLVGAAKRLGVSDAYPEIHSLAGMGIPGMAMAKQVDAVVAVTGNNLSYAIPITLRRGGYLTALLCTESPYQTIDREQHDSAVYDLTFTCDRAAVPLFKRSRAGSVYYLAHAYDPGVHQPGEPDPSKVCDVFFCGTRFPERTALLDGIDWTGIDLRDKSVRYDQHATLEEISAQVVPNTTAAAWYRSAKININHHRTIKHPKEAAEIGAGEAESLNPRAYEIAACGGFQVCDRSRPELFDVFGGSVPTYTDSASLEHLIRYYLTHTEEREALRQRQYQAVLHHSWKERAKEVLLVLERHRYQLA